MNILKLLLAVCFMALAGCGVTVSGGVGLNAGLNGLNGPNGQLRPSPQNAAFMLNQRCPHGTTLVSDTGIVAGPVDQQVDARSNLQPSRSYGRGGNRNRSPYGQGTVRRDTQQESTRTLTCDGPQGLIERKVGVDVRRRTDSRGASWGERPFDSGWRTVRQNNRPR